MKHNHVTVFYAHINGSKVVDASNSLITFVRAYGVNGTLVDCDWAELRFVPFGQLHLRRLDERERSSRHPEIVQPYERLLDSYTEEDWLEETTDEVIVIPVSSMDISEKSDGTYADLAA
jgi:hypothetical protein